MEGRKKELPVLGSDESSVVHGLARSLWWAATQLKVAASLACLQNCTTVLQTHQTTQGIVDEFALF